MELKYFVCNPTGNITILVEGDVRAENRAAVAAELMKREPTAEQVGFISYGGKKSDVVSTDADAGASSSSFDIRLDMAGGEFCGNATMSAAVLCVLGESQKRGEQRTFPVSVSSSGAEGIRKVLVEALEDGSYRGTVCMPEPLSIRSEKLFFEGKEYCLPVVDFGGITHVVVEVPEQGEGEAQTPGLFLSSLNGFGIRREKAEKAVREWCGALHAACLGLMIYDSHEGRLDPLVFVPGAETLFWESSCASGTTAVGAYLAHKRGESVTLDLKEPGGVLKISANSGGKLLLTGNVKLNFQPFFCKIDILE